MQKPPKNPPYIALGGAFRGFSVAFYDVESGLVLSSWVLRAIIIPDLIMIGGQHE